MSHWELHAAALGQLTYLEATLIVAVLFLLFMIWKLTHHQECHFAGAPDPAITESLDALAGSTHARLLEGNSLVLVQNEAYFDKLTEMIDDATTTVHFETFLWVDGEASNRLVGSLVAAARRGANVRIMADASGSSGLSKETIRRLKSGSCEFHLFHRYGLKNLGRMNIRDHRKLLVVDGRKAIVGGHCITDQWLCDGEKLPRHRDISAIIEGPVVSSIQSCFFENWTETTKELFTDTTTFPELLKEAM